jgi:hypothetical protein
LRFGKIEATNIQGDKKIRGRKIMVGKYGLLLRIERLLLKSKGQVGHFSFETKCFITVENPRAIIRVFNLRL